MKSDHALHTFTYGNTDEFDSGNKKWCLFFVKRERDDASRYMLKQITYFLQFENPPRQEEVKVDSPPFLLVRGGKAPVSCTIKLEWQPWTEIDDLVWNLREPHILKDHGAGMSLAVEAKIPPLNEPGPPGDVLVELFED